MNSSGGACCFCDSRLDAGGMLTFDGRARCDSRECALAEDRARERARPAPRRGKRVTYRDANGRERSYVDTSR